MQNMTGPRGGFPGQMPQQQLNMPRNPQGPLPVPQQVQRHISGILQGQQASVPQGWQKTVAIQQRVMTIFHLFSQLKLVQPGMPPAQVVDVALKFEQKTFLDSPDKDTYDAQCRSKLQDITHAREKQAMQMQQQMQDPRMQMMPQQMAVNGMSMQGQGQFQGAFSNPMQQMQQVTPQLQAGNMNALNEQALRNQQAQRNMQGQMAKNPGQPMNNFTPEQNAQINQLAQNIARSTSREQMAGIQQKLQNVPPNMKQLWASQGLTPLHVFFRNSAMKQLQQNQQNPQNQPNQPNPQQSPANQQGQPNRNVQQTQLSQGNNFNQPQPISRNPSNGPTQPFSQAPSNFDGQLNMGQIHALQQEAARARLRGQEVVPASGQQPHQVRPGVVPTPQPAHVEQPQNPPRPPQNNAQQQPMLQAQRARMAMAGNQGPIPPQQPALQSQLGGLTPKMGQPTQQSPAMPTLNRPIETPLQGTPNQQPPPQAQQVTPNPMQNQQPAMAEAMRSNAAMQNAKLQQYLASLPEPARTELVTRIKAQAAQRNGLAQAGMLGMGPRQPRQPQQLNTNFQPTPGVVPNQQTNQQLFPSQPFGQFPGGTQMQNQQFQNRPPGPLNEAQMRKMDVQRFPPGMLDRHNFQGQLPPQIVTWGQLKQWATQHAARLPPGFLDKLKSLQTLQYYYHSPPQDGQPSPNAQTQVPMPQPGPAPQVNMVRPQPPQPRPPGSFPQPITAQMAVMKPVTPEEMQIARSQLPEQAKNISDIQLQRFLIKRRQEMMMQQAMRSGNLQQIQQLQALQQMQQQHMAHQQQQQQQQPQQQQQIPLGQPPNPYAQAPQQRQNLQQQPVVTTDGRKAATPKPTPSQQPRQLGNPGQPGNPKKRGNEEVVEIPPPTSQPQAQSTGKPTPKQKPTSSLTEKAAPQAKNEHTKTIPPMASTPNLQIGKNPPASDEAQRKMKLEQLVRDTSKYFDSFFSNKKPTPPAPQNREKIIKMLKSSESYLKHIDGFVGGFYYATNDERATRDLIMTRLLVLKQFKDKSFAPIDQFTITPEELDTSLKKIQQAFQLVINKKKADTQQTAATNLPLNAANLQQNQQALEAARQMHMKNNNRDSRPPAAPTTSQAPFSFAAHSPPPHGIPQAYGPGGLTQDQLKPPPTKKQKRNQAGSTVTTPAQVGTPGASGSPRIEKSPQLPQPKILCPVSDCSLHKQGFVTEDELAKHTAEVHDVKEPIIDDPLMWALENVRIGLNLDENGKVKLKEKSGPVEMKLSASNQGQTPIKMEGGTPMSRTVTQNGYTGDSKSVSKIPEEGKKSDAGKDALSPPQDAWENVAISPAQLSASFPTLSDLQSTLSFSGLTPSSTSSGKSEKNSPKPSDIGEDDSLKINIETEGWVPPEFYGDILDPLFDESMLTDDILSMPFDDVFGKAKGGDDWQSEEFDPSLFLINM